MKHVLKIIALACVAVPALVILFDAGVILANPGFSPVVHTISEFVLGSLGWLEKAGLYLISLLLLAMSFVWFFPLGKEFGHPFRIAGAMLFIAGIAFALTATFNTHPPHTAITIPSQIHGISTGVVTILFPGFCILTGWGLKRARRFLFLRWFSLFTGVLGYAMLIWTTVAVAISTEPGLPERIMTLLYLLWTAVVGYYLVRFAVERTSPAYISNSQKRSVVSG